MEYLLGSRHWAKPWDDEVTPLKSGGSVKKKKKKNLSVNVRDTGSTSGSERSTGEGNGNLLQYSCLGNPMDRA